MKTDFSELQLDALRELANIGSGNAGTALSSMIGLPVDISVPHVHALPLAEAVEAVGDPEQEVTAVLIPIVGDIGAIVMLLFPPGDAERLCVLLGVEPGSEVGISALGEIGNILGTSYINSLAGMIGMELEPTPPQTVTDMLGALVASVLAIGAEDDDLALMLDSDLHVEGEACSLAFMLIPSTGGITDLLARLGLG